jgi:hypothetical protein
VTASHYVGLQPTWKANLRFLSANLFTFVVGAARACRAHDHALPELRRLRQPWSVEDLASCFVVKARGGQELAYIYYEDEPRRRAIVKLLRSRGSETHCSQHRQGVPGQHAVIVGLPVAAVASVAVLALSSDLT